MPVIRASALFVLAGDGSAREAGLDLKLSKFGPGRTPSGLCFRHARYPGHRGSRRSPITVRARARTGHCRCCRRWLCLRGRPGTRQVLSPKTATTPAGEAFAHLQDRDWPQAKLGTLPPGGVPTVALHHWLWKVGKVDRADIEIVNMGIEVVQQAMLIFEISMAAHCSSLRPHWCRSGIRASSASSTRRTCSRTFRGSSSLPRGASSRAALMWPSASSACSIGRPSRLRDEPAKAAPHVLAALGGGLVAEAAIARALASPAVSFVNDPASIRKATEELLAYQVELGDFRKRRRSTVCSIRRSTRAASGQRRRAERRAIAGPIVGDDAPGLGEQPGAGVEKQ